jgi:hypothetical protein
VLPDFEIVREHHTAKTPKGARRAKSPKRPASSSRLGAKSSGGTTKHPGDRRGRKRATVNHAASTKYGEHKHAGKSTTAARPATTTRVHPATVTRYGASPVASHSHSGVPRSVKQAHAARRPHNGEPKY